MAQLVGEKLNDSLAANTATGIDKRNHLALWERRSRQRCLNCGQCRLAACRKCPYREPSRSLGRARLDHCPPELWVTQLCSHLECFAPYFCVLIDKQPQRLIRE